jgi:hypothetical protein
MHVVACTHERPCQQAAPGQLAVVAGSLPQPSAMDRPCLALQDDPIDSCELFERRQANIADLGALPTLPRVCQRSGCRCHKKAQRERRDTEHTLSHRGFLLAFEETRLHQPEFSRADCAVCRSSEIGERIVECRCRCGAPPRGLQIPVRRGKCCERAGLGIRQDGGEGDAAEVRSAPTTAIVPSDAALTASE